MTPKQAEQFERMRAALTVIAKDFQTPHQLRRSASASYGLTYEEALEGAYENIKGKAADALHGVRRLPHDTTGQGAGGNQP
jgi:uncharacterized protein (UPF0147 family)